jgi:hydrogenase maturation protease
VVAHEDPTALLDLMQRGTETGWQLVVVVDAVRAAADSSSGANRPGPGPAPGAVVVLETGPGQPPLPAHTNPGPAGTHGIGLAGALELARALDRLPPRVLVVGVVGTDFGHGRPLSGPVDAAVPDAVAAVLAAVSGRERPTPED